MTKSVDFETSLINVSKIVVDVGAFLVVGGTGGLVLAMSVRAGVLGLWASVISPLYEERVAGWMDRKANIEISKLEPCQFASPVTHLKILKRPTEDFLSGWRKIAIFCFHRLA